MADATDSKSVVGNNVRVQVPPSAPNTNKTNLEDNLKFVLFFFKICIDIKIEFHIWIIDWNKSTLNLI